MSKKLAILVIDDEVPLENIYINFLSRLGADVDYCDHPQKGWQLIEKNKYDLIITDLKMPVIPGDEFISIVRESKLNVQTPIILCSGYINKLVMTEMAREGKVYFLSKPFDSKGLLDLVGRIVGVKKGAPEAGTLALNEKWLSEFSGRLSAVLGSEARFGPIKHFAAWNFETVAVSFSLSDGIEHVNVALVMKPKTFLDIAGKIQGTHYREIDEEGLSVWQELIGSVSNCVGRPTFSKVLRQEIIAPSLQGAGFYLFESGHGEIQAFIN